MLIIVVMGIFILAGLLLVAGVIAGVVYLLMRAGRGGEGMEGLGRVLAAVARPRIYFGKKYLMSQGEAAFFRVLRQAVEGEYCVMAMVRLGDLVYAKGNPSERTTASNKLRQKQVDFVLLDVRDLRIRLVIELDDPSHGLERRRDRDAYVDETLREAGLTLLRVPTAGGYRVEELAKRVREAVGEGK